MGTRSLPRATIPRHASGKWLRARCCGGLGGHTSFVKSAVFSSDNRFVLTASWDNTARLWDASTGQELEKFNEFGGKLNSAVFSPDGHTILTASWDRTARLVDVATGEERRRFKGHTQGVTSAVFAPDGRTILTASEDGSARLWGLISDRELQKFSGDSRTYLKIVDGPQIHLYKSGHAPSAR